MDSYDKMRADFNRMRDAERDLIAAPLRAEIARLRAAVEEALKVAQHPAEDWCPEDCSGCESMSVLTAALSPAPGEEEACTWTEDGGGEWRTTCGESWVTLDGEPPDEHHVRFCHGCGRRAALAPFSPEDGAAPASEPEEDEGQKHSIDECPACGGWMPQFSEKVHDGMAYECKSCGAEVIGYVLDGRVWTEAAPYEAPPEEARGEERCDECHTLGVRLVMARDAGDDWERGQIRKTYEAHRKATPEKASEP